MAWSHGQVAPPPLDAPCSLLASRFLTLSCSSTSGISQLISANMGPCVQGSEEAQGSREARPWPCRPSLFPWGQ